NFIEAGRAERLVGTEAMALALRSRFLTVLGEFDAAAESLQAAFALVPRIPPESNPVFQVLAAPLLSDMVRGVVLSDDAMEAVLAFAERPDTQWAALATRLAGARSFAINRKTERALDMLDSCIAGIDRAAAWAPNAPLVVAFAVDTIWALNHTDHIAVLERNL